MTPAASVSRDALATSGGRQQGSLGAFGGVFTPSVLTILGIILFLRTGWVVGHAGLTRALIIVALAHSVSILTSLSLAAIATNLKVRGGGDYFLISRSLGLEYGGALGLVLFFAQSISVAFYCFGFGEAVATLLPEGPLVSSRTLALAAVLLLFGIAYAGADLATRFQYGIMLAISAALGSFIWGVAQSWDPERVAQAWDAPVGGLGFWTLFAVFFPAVTGFTQGVSMSGDLKRPSDALPKGTFAAVGVSLVTYLGVTVAFAGVLPLDELTVDYLAFRRVSILPMLFTVGVVAATLSSALASFMGAPRIIQAMATDKVFPVIGPLADGHGPTRNPRRATLVTAGIALVVVGLGNLNGVASVISMFFLISYGLLNYATYIAARGASPSFRPRFRLFHAQTSLAGALICLATMLAIDVMASAFALTVLGGLYQYLKNRSVPARWADSRRAFEFRKLKEIVADIDGIPETEWTWQPQVAAVTEVSDRRDLVVRFGSWLSGTSGFTSAVGIIPNGTGPIETQARRRAAEAEIRRDLDELALDAVPLVVAAPDTHTAVETIVQTWGIGAVRVNTALIDLYTDREETPSADLQTLRGWLPTALAMQCNVVALELTGKKWRRIEALPAEERRIDVWWWENASCRLGLLFAYLMTRAEEWDNARIRVLAPCASSRGEGRRGALRQMLDEARIDASIETLENVSPAKIASVSCDSSVAFFPLLPNGSDSTTLTPEDLLEVLEQLPITCLVSAARDLKLTDGPEP